MFSRVSSEGRLSASRVTRVRLRRVSLAFGSTVALRSVSAVFDPGVVHLVAGPNGSGKSTLLRVAATMLAPSSGDVFFSGVDRDRVRGTMGWVSHEALVYPDLSGSENLALFAGLYGLSPAAVLHSAQQRFGLGSYVNRPVRTMSRGQRQRVALARALCHAPSLLLLDEPLTGLDSHGVGLLVRVVDEELRAGAVVILVTHDLAPFASLASRRWDLDRGRWLDAQLR